MACNLDKHTSLCNMMPTCINQALMRLMQVTTALTMETMAMAHLLVLSWRASEKKTTVQGQQGHNAMQKLLASPLVPWNQSQSQSQNNLPPQ
jgi:hypothetical protein